METIPSEQAKDIDFPTGLISPQRLCEISRRAKTRFKGHQEFRGAAKLIIAGFPEDERQELMNWAEKKCGGEYNRDYAYWIVFALYNAALPERIKRKTPSFNLCASLMAHIWALGTMRGTLLPERT